MVSFDPSLRTTFDTAKHEKPVNINNFIVKYGRDAGQLEIQNLQSICTLNVVHCNALIHRVYIEALASCYLPLYICTLPFKSLDNICNFWDFMANLERWLR